MPVKKRILLISYYFPPLGLGGVGRPLALFKYLPRFGYDVTVLTVKDILYPEHDDTLIEGLNREDIVRTGSFDPARLMHLLGMKGAGIGNEKKARRQSVMYYPDAKRGWNFFAGNKAKKLLERQNISAVITTSPPPSSHLIGLRLKRETSIPWIADFRDLWFSRPIDEVYRNKLNLKYAFRLRERILAQADEVVAVNSDIKKYLGRGEVITNGADMELLDHWRKSSPEKGDKLIIGVLGTVNDLCTIEPILRGVGELIAKNPEMKARVEIIHVGQYERSAVLSQIEKYSLRGNVILKGYLPKAEAIKTISQADVLYISVEKAGGFNILPGRVFDYLISGKPILGVVVENSDCADLLRKSGRGTVVPDGDAVKISRYLDDALDAKRKMPQSKVPSTEEARQYSSLATAEKYAALLDRILK